MTDKIYTAINYQLSALCDGVKYPITILSNASALLFDMLDDINWAGFYLLSMTDGHLILGPFQGKPACIEIGVGKGVCGAAILSGETLVVGDVHMFPGHIACDSDSRSEIVIPLVIGGGTYGVLDIDSPSVGRFNENDRRGLEEFSRILCRALETTSGVSRLI